MENLKDTTEVNVGGRINQVPREYLKFIAVKPFSTLVPSALNVPWDTVATAVSEKKIGLGWPLTIAGASGGLTAAGLALKEQLGRVAEGVRHPINIFLQEVAGKDWRDPVALRQVFDAVNARTDIDISSLTWLSDTAVNILGDGDMNKVGAVLLAALSCHVAGKFAEWKMYRDMNAYGDNVEGNLSRLFNTAWHLAAPTILDKVTLKSQWSEKYAKVIRVARILEVLPVGLYLIHQDWKIMEFYALLKSSSLLFEGLDKIQYGFEGFYNVMSRFGQAIGEKGKQVLERLRKERRKPKFSSRDVGVGNDVGVGYAQGIHTQDTQEVPISQARGPSASQGAQIPEESGLEPSNQSGRGSPYGGEAGDFGGVIEGEVVGESEFLPDAGSSIAGLLPEFPLPAHLASIYNDFVRKNGELPPEEAKALIEEFDKRGNMTEEEFRRLLKNYWSRN
ncbi:MAG: hypothetical protein NZM26_04280 [Patescibacteria group bacterium]|nr:hypothetical protein [Patescibacteria group bacterium]